MIVRVPDELLKIDESIRKTLLASNASGADGVSLYKQLQSQVGLLHSDEAFANCNWILV